MKKIITLKRILFLIIILSLYFLFRIERQNSKINKLKESVDSLKIEVRENINSKDSLILNGLDSLLKDVKRIALNHKSKKSFLLAIGHRESGNNYDIENKFGYLGKYQFSLSTLKGLGIKTTKEEFLKNPKLQENAMDKLLAFNKKILKDCINEYKNTIIDYKKKDGSIEKFKVTESGILAAAHLSGAGNVKKFFKSNYKRITKDAFGTSLLDYMKEFSGYKI